MYTYFHRDEHDIEYYRSTLLERLPSDIIDAHAHFNLPEHVSGVTQETIKGDWALECGLLMSKEDADYYSSTMFPGKIYKFVALPWPLYEADTVGNNKYIEQLIINYNMRGLCTVRPEYSAEYVEKLYVSGSFCGFKPYPYMADAKKGAEISIFDFMPHEHFKVADRLCAPVLIHLPRAGRLPDVNNIREIREILENYPNVKLILAHFGRCFNHEYFEQALLEMGKDANSLWFDCAAVMNPKVYELAFDQLDYKRILFGTDLPIMLWHGTREWHDKGYHNLCREDFSWNSHKYAEKEKAYTFFVYEQMNNILNIIGNNKKVCDSVFHDNAAGVYRSSAII